MGGFVVRKHQILPFVDHYKISTLLRPIKENEYNSFACINGHHLHPNNNKTTTTTTKGSHFETSCVAK
jgi:hypothetical protein